MLRRTSAAYKKKFTLHPRSGGRGVKNLAWRPKMAKEKLYEFVWAYNLESPGRIPASWSPLECQRLGLQSWPKEVGFYNAGDNFELTPEMHWRLFNHNHERSFWTPDHNEKTIIALMPLVEADPAATLPKVSAIFKSHVARFGADHIIYNATTQAYAFAKDFDGVMRLFKEMRSLSLEPNAQSYINLILAMRLCGKPKAAALDLFTQAVNQGALTAVMRIDTEFEMWWSQLERLGSFTSDKGYLSNKDEGAVPLPRDPFAIWGWSRDERKFVPRWTAVQAEYRRRTRGTGMTGTVHNQVKREPWFRYRGYTLRDFKGPLGSARFRDVNAGAPRVTADPYAPRTP